MEILLLGDGEDYSHNQENIYNYILPFIQTSHQTSFLSGLPDCTSTDIQVRLFPIIYQFSETKESI